MESMATTRARPTHPRNAAATRERILGEALAAFARSGYEGVSLDALALAAGVRKATLFYYFASKAELYAEVGRSVARHFAPVAERLAREEPGPTGVDGTIGELHDRLARSPDSARVLMREAFDARDGAANLALAPLLDLGERWVARGQALGVFTRELEPRAALVAILGAVSMVFLNPQLFRKGVLDDAAVAAHRAAAITFVRGALVSRNPRRRRRS
jgi:TetR/AcrR family transcriptional regulator